jgi:hypothetical protein
MQGLANSEQFHNADIQEVLSDPDPAQWVQIGQVSLALLPDGSLASVLVIDGAGSPDQTSQSPADKSA